MGIRNYVIRYRLWIYTVLLPLFFLNAHSSLNAQYLPLPPEPGQSGFGQSGLQRLDFRILNNLAAHRTPGQTIVWRAISDANNYVNIALPAGLLVAGLIRNDVPMKENALYIASSGAVSALLNYGIKQLIKRPRPFVVNVYFTPVYRNGGYSFPSGHTSLSFSTATALSRAYPKWYVIAPSFLWAASVGYSRMYLGVHNPSDVTAGALLGVGTAFGMGFIRP
ncbi:phosphatase PAP2 family protein [Flavitalea flava]